MGAYIFHRSSLVSIILLSLISFKSLSWSVGYIFVKSGKNAKNFIHNKIERQSDYDQNFFHVVVHEFQPRKQMRICEGGRFRPKGLT